MIVNFFDMETLKKNELKTKKDSFNLIIFFGIDLESILISRILVTFFQNKFVSYELYSIHSWEKLNKRCKKFANQKLESLQLFLINFGGNANLKKFLDKNFPIFLNIFVFHPISYIHEQNVISKRIFVFNSKFGLFSDHKRLNTENYLEVVKFKNFPAITQIFSNFLFRTENEKIENLWFQILSISHLYFSKKIDDDTNLTEMKILEQKLDGHLNKKKHAEKKNQKILPNNLTFNSIEPSLEISISLVRHWSLLDSIINTPKLFSYFCLWKKRGIKKLSKFFLKLGFSMKEAGTRWSLLKSDKKKRFKLYFQDELNRFGIHILKYNSFVKTYFFKNYKEKPKNQKIEARDFIYGLYGLLDFELLEFKKKKKTKKFTNCFKSLSRFKYIKLGIKISKKILQFSSRLSRLIFVKKAYVPETYFCYSFLKNVQHFKITYEMIKNLSFFLISIFSSERDNEKEIFILFIPFYTKTLIAGHILKKNQKKNQRRIFNFRNTILEIGADVGEDLFFFLEIEKCDEIKFLKKIKKF